MRKPIIVLGMHRGGTSLIGGILQGWGAFAGDNELLIPADEHNLQGYWEYIPLVQLNQHLLKNAGASWSVPPRKEDEPALEASAFEPFKRQKAIDLLRSMAGENNPWFWKDPRTSILLPFWKRVWGQVTYIITVRHPLEIAMSLRKRDRLPISASLLLWQKYMVDTLRHTEGAASRLFVEFESLTRNPEEECARFAAFLENQYGLGRYNQETLARMRQAINPSLRHNRSIVGLSQIPQATDEQKALYALLQRKLIDPTEPFEESAFSLYAGWREYLQTLAVLNQVWPLFKDQSHALLARISTAQRELFGV